MTWLLLALSCAAFVEAVVRLDVAGLARAAAAVARKVVSVVGSSRVSDHWKEKALQLYARKLLSTSLRLFLAMLVAIAPMALAAALSGGRSSSFSQLISSGAGMLAATLFATLYAAARSRFAGK